MNHPSPTARLSNSLQRDGLAATARKCVLAPCRQIRSWRQRYDRWRLNRSSDPQVIFQMIHRLNVWDDSESVSGPGSTLDYTTTLRQHLPLVFQQQAVDARFDTLGQGRDVVANPAATLTVVFRQVGHQDRYVVKIDDQLALDFKNATKRATLGDQFAQIVARFITTCGQCQAIAFPDDMHYAFQLVLTQRFQRQERHRGPTRRGTRDERRAMPVP